MKKRGKIYVMGVDQMVLPLAKHFAREGSTPTIAKLLERGCANKVLANYPCWTPNNWPVISTGAQSGTHGAMSWFIHMPDGEDVSSLTSLGINAEFIWDAAERQGLKSAILHYPGSQPSRVKNSYVIDGNAGPAFDGCPFELATAEAYTTDRQVESKMLKEVVLKPADGWEGLPSVGLQPLATSIPVSAKREEDSQSWQVVALAGANGYDRVVVCKEKDLATPLCEARLDGWSEWALVSIGEKQGYVRFKLTELSPDGKTMKLYRSQIMPVDGFSDPPEISGELTRVIGPYQEYVSQMFNVLGILDYQTCVEEAEYQMQWFAKAALYLGKEKGCDLFMSHWHFLDDVNHFHLAHLDPSWRRYDPNEAPKHWDMVRQAYQAIDHGMATLLEGVTEDDYVVMVSDHGCSAIDNTVHMERFLYEKGFLVFKDPENTVMTCFTHGWHDKIDWEKTKVWTHEGVFMDPFNIFINARSPEEYKTIQRDLVRELRTWVDPENNCTPIALALPKRDAELIGLWGDQCGDVVAVCDTGYTVAKRAGTKPLSKNTGHVASGHGRTLPTSETEYATEKAIFTIMGPGIKQGYERPADKLGHIKLIDVTPTLCHLMGIEPPAQSQGAVAYDLLEGHEMARERPNPTPQWGPTRQYKKWMQHHLYEWGLMKEETIPC